MSQENVDVARKNTVAFNRRDLPALAEMCDEDFEFVSVLTAVDETTYTGKNALATYFGAMDEAWAEWRTKDFQFFDTHGDRVVVVCRLVGKSRQGGVPLEREIGLLYTIRHGKVWRLRGYLDPREALKAIGLSE
jgi:ketosteroid isomerase-like protein